MQYQVPQFIEVEDKIFGPLTLRQFIYVAGGVGLCVVLYFFMPLIIAIPLMVPVAGFSFALAFYKVNNKPFINVLEAATAYFFRSKLYIWKKQDRKPEEIRKSEENILTPFLAPKLSDSKLKELSWSLDVTDKIQSGVGGAKKNVFMGGEDHIT